MHQLLAGQYFDLQLLPSDLRNLVGYGWFIVGKFYCMLCSLYKCHVESCIKQLSSQLHLFSRIQSDHNVSRAPVVPHPTRKQSASKLQLPVIFVVILTFELKNS